MAVNLVNLESVAKAHGTTTILDGVSLGVAEGERVGVVGRNGSGKSTLLAVLVGDEPIDAGRVTRAGAVTVGRLAQGDTLDPTATVLDAVVGAAAGHDWAEHEWAGDARIRGVLSGLLADLSPDAVVGTLSGGERRRVALAALLVAAPDLLVLDEPTNHLDVDGVTWLAEHLRGRRGALVVVTHDRWFLDAVCDRTWEVAGGAVLQYDGGYAAYILARAERERQAAATEERRRNLLRKELAWLRRGPPARTSKPRFRIEAANALIEGEPPPRETVELRRFAATRLGKDVYDVEDVSVTLGTRTLLDTVTWRVGPGDRVGLLGPNGAGKTTLLRLLTGDVAPTAGRVRVGRTVAAGVLSQHVTELDPSRRVLEAAEDVARRVDLGGGREVTASSLLERLGFPPARQWTPVGDLSGGELRRLQLLRLLMAGPNVLLLDEPTNDLDVETLSEVEDVLDGWAGTLVVVSHDRWFLERVTDTVYALPGDGSLRHLPGGVEEYLELRRRAATAATTAAAAPAPVSAAPASSGDARAARKEMARVERQLERLARRERTLHDDLAAHATDHERVAALDTELRAVHREREELEEAWLAAAEVAS